MPKPALAALLLTAPWLALACQDANHPPALALLDDRWVFVGERLEVPLVGTDPDGDRLRFSVSGLPDAADIVADSSLTARLVWSPSITDTEPGGRVYRATVTASDGHGGAASQDLNVTVLPTYGVPVFDLPGGVVLNLALEDHLTLPVAVKDDDSTEVALSLAEGPDGVKLTRSGPKSALLFFRPEGAQLDRTVHRVLLRADDGDHPPVTHALLVVLLNAGKGAGCAGVPPTVKHTAPADAAPGVATVPLAALVSDADSTVASVTVQWTTGDPTAGTTSLPLARDEALKGTWAGEVAAGDVPAGGALLRYALVARDNDDATGVACDRETRVPASGWLAVGLYPPGAAADACVDDAAEPDDTLGAAPALAPGAYTARRLCGTAPDLARVDLAAGETLAAAVRRVPAHGEVAVRLLDGAGAELAAATGPDETLTVRDLSGAAGPRFVEVRPAGGPARLTYALEVTVGVASCPADALEPNDGPAAAADVGPGVLEGLVVCAGDEDWLRVSLGAGERLVASLDADHAAGDLELELRDAAGAEVLVPSGGPGAAEALSWVAPAAGPVLLRVSGFEGATNGYGLDLAVEPAGAACDEDLMGPHASAAKALVLFSGLYENLRACAGADDWFAVDLNGGETLDVLVEPSGGPVEVSVHAEPGGPALDGASAPAGGLAAVGASADGPGRLWYRVAGSGATYTLLQGVTDPPGPCQADRFEPNDDPAAGAPVDDGVLTWLRLCGMGDRDTFRVEVGAFDQLVVLTRHEAGEGYTDAKLYGPDGALVAEQLDYWDGVELGWLAEEAGSYTVVIEPFDVTALPYDLAILLK